MPKIIVAAPPVSGELAPLLELARRLAGRGHQITVLTGSRFRTEVEEGGLGFEPLTGAADFDDRLYGDLPERADLAPGPEQLNFDWIHAFADPMPDQHARLQELLERDPDQYLISNALFLGALPPALGAPGRKPLRWVAVSAVPLALSSQDTTFFGPVPVGPGQDPKAANRAANAEFAAAMRPVQDRINELLHTLGAQQTFPAFVDGIITVPDRTAALTVPGFEFDRGDAPDSVHLVGTLTPQHAADWRPPSWWSDLDGSRPVVVVTQGTMANRDLSQLIEPALAALADLDVTVVAALGRELEALSVPLPANARAAEYIPFAALLPKADLLITNGGAGGIHQALSAGVPVIAAGLTEDKPANAARIAHHGLGAGLQTATPTAEVLAETAEKVLKDTEIHDNVQRLKRVYEGLDTVAEIERLTIG
ncbi:nucleotide disphospho-sugar-binding domain-containing protein [Catenulispora pinisilvae]|uniref:nucleotide disphospho-sugar-binding domain-containing protein n=1 Tax=Catenulispora pinisilvae TaxID=2705253 RepID=UPI001890FEC6|nr:nucleotide disphospho-sugar-binding domain-containing protein [Catenulispora pinisilvae]